MYSLTLPYPISVNRIYKPNPRGGIYKTQEAKDYQKLAGLMASLAVDEPLEGDVVVELRVYRPRKRGDQDNIEKLLFDSLNGIVWLDDEQICEKHAYRYDGTPETARVELKAYSKTKERTEDYEPTDDSGNRSRHTGRNRGATGRWVGGARRRRLESFGRRETRNG